MFRKMLKIFTAKQAIILLLALHFVLDHCPDHSQLFDLSRSDHCLITVHFIGIIFRNVARVFYKFCRNGRKYGVRLAYFYCILKQFFFVHSINLMSFDDVFAFVTKIHILLCIARTRQC